jgi:hypothetical protein
MRVPRSRAWSTGAAIVSVGLLAAVVAGPVFVNAGGPEKKGDPAGGMVTWQAGPAAPTPGITADVAVPVPTNLDYVGLARACRFFGTKVAGGPLKKNVARDLPVLDADLATGLGPCGVPADAKGILVTLGTYSGTPVGAGTLKVGVGGVAPTLAVLQFAKGQAVVGTAFVPLSATGRIRVTSSAATAAFGDIQGYFKATAPAPAPLFKGRVNTDGTLISGTGVVSITKSGSFAGDYYIYADRALTGCIPSVTMESDAGRAIVAWNNTYLYVDIREYNTMNEADGTFDFVMLCD